jgi:hypothetical protein
MARGKLCCLDLNDYLVLSLFAPVRVQVGKQAIFQEPKAAPPSGQPPRQFDHTSMLATAKSFFKLGVLIR